MNSPKNTTIIFAGLAILLSYSLNSCKPIDYEGKNHLSNLIPTINDWSFSAKIDAFLIRQKKATAILELEGQKIKFQLIEPENVTPLRSHNQYNHRNGIVEPLIVEFQGNKATYSISIVN